MSNNFELYILWSCFIVRKVAYQTMKVNDAKINSKMIYFSFEKEEV